MERVSLAPRFITAICGRGRLTHRPPARETKMSSSSEMKKVRRQLERLGFTATKTRRGHWKFGHPDMEGFVFAAATPSDYRAIKNLFAELRRRMRPPSLA